MSKKKQSVIILFVATCLCFYPVEARLQEPASGSAQPANLDESLVQEAPASYPSENTISDSKTSLETVETEISAFSLRGKRRRERLEILDLDILITPAGRRFFPLFRLLDALKVEWTEENRQILFQPEGCPEVVLDIQKNEIKVNNVIKPLKLIIAVSDITMEQDIFLLPEVISEIFAIELEWDDEDYAFKASTEMSLHIWKRPKGVSLLGIETEELVAKLPEAHGPALPSRRKLSLDFMELQAQIKYKAVDPNSSGELQISSLEQTLWGAFAKGRYKIKITEPYQTYDGSKFESEEGPPVMVNYGEWRYATENAETVIGDSNFGLNDLIFPTVGMAGLRINGLWGFDETVKDKDPSEFGLRNRFTAPLKFEGYAPVGSHVELIVNDRVVDTDEVIMSLPSMPGTGMYSFEDVILAPGSLNDIRIEITDPDGVVTVIEKSILGASTLLPKGGLASLTGVGTNRDTDEWDARGLFSGGRLFYGITDRFTVGATIAYQEDFFEPVDLDSSDPEDRQYPESSLHAGVQLTWKPSDRSIFLGDFAWAQGNEGEYEEDEDESLEDRDGEQFSDMSFKLDWHYFPAKKVDIEALYFWYGPDFFNGANRDLRDRQGYVLNADWRAFSSLSFDAAGGQVWDNVNDDRDETLSVDFQSAKVTSNIIPRTRFSFLFDRLSPNWDEDPKTLFTAKLRTTPFHGLQLTGSYSTGDDLDLDENDDFLQGLRLPGISLYASRKTEAVIRKTLPWGGSLALSYWETVDRERASVIHTDRFDMWIPVEMRTEVGYNIDKSTMFFENRTEIPLGGSRRSRMGMIAKFDREEWKVEFYINVTELFSFIGGHPRHISSSRRINPDMGAICGKVFLDRNANAVLDPEETGVADVEVLLNNRRSVDTDENGYFIHSLPGNARQVQMNLNPDTIPAIYSCTHGRQKANLRKSEITRIDFGVTPVNIITGYVLSGGGEDEAEPVSGVLVYLTPAGSDDLVAESVTADDGSYYLEDVRPGKYTFMVDAKTIPFDSVIKEMHRIIEILPADEPQEIQLQDIIFVPAEGKGDEPMSE